MNGDQAEILRLLKRIESKLDDLERRLRNVESIVVQIRQRQ